MRQEVLRHLAPVSAGATTSRQMAQGSTSGFCSVWPKSKLQMRLNIVSFDVLEMASVLNVDQKRAM